MRNSSENQARPGVTVVVLPALNEALNISPLLERLTDAFSGTRGAWEVLVVDDGSTDATADVAESLAALHPVRVLRHPRNLGLDRALTTGLLAAVERGDVVVTMDADNTHDPSLIPAMLVKLGQGYDIVVASRFQPGAAEIGVPQHRRFLSHSVSRLMRVVGNVPGVRDYSCGYRAYRADFLRTMVRVYGPSHLLTGSGFACMVELLLKASELGARVTELPLVLRYDRKEGASKMRIGRTVRRYGTVVWQHRSRVRQARLAARVTADPNRREWAHRGLSTVLAGGTFLVTLPLFAAVAGLVRLGSTGPALVRYPRIGRDRRVGSGPKSMERRDRDLGGEPFDLLRFRTTLSGPPPRGLEDDPALDSPDVTRLGRLLRRTRLDELPQLLNVLGGDMNLVGPRPVSAELAEQLRNTVAGYPLRHRVRPGLTGWAQVHHFEARTSEELTDRVLHDLHYVSQRSVLTDLEILARTVPVVVTGKGAS